ncbi:hypothetical protein [Natronorubrum texcoconense]|uniref:Uncharacterized protein n=1 Tax=Natronorubrum texcoconense TaxID=1095776 RepID=A0A1G8YYJ4_9EURY|nr:hypothetical protein [Natronorubrum texcoconense]SDK07145.1 hypothetical protein SAMN04515672_2329 [Natronorubrum texcoconense]
MVSDGNSPDVPEQTIGQRVLNGLDRLQTAYNDIENRTHSVLPTISRGLELVLAVALFVGLGYWLYTFLLVP